MKMLSYCALLIRLQQFFGDQERICQLGDRAKTRLYGIPQGFVDVWHTFKCRKGNDGAIGYKWMD